MNAQPLRATRPRLGRSDQDLVQGRRARRWFAKVVWGRFALGLLACRPGASGETTPREQAPASASAEAIAAGEAHHADGGEAGSTLLPDADADAGEPSGPNEAAELVANAGRITAVVVVDADRKPVGELPAEAVDQLRRALAAGPSEDLTLTAPPWDIALQISVDGALGFVAIPVGTDRARLSPTHPYDPRYADDEGRLDPRVREVVVSEAVHDAIGGLVGPPTAKEFQVAPPPRRGTGPFGLRAMTTEVGPE